jgi:hypothetical protein
MIATIAILTALLFILIFFMGIAYLLYVQTMHEHGFERRKVDGYVTWVKVNPSVVDDAHSDDFDQNQ